MILRAVSSQAWWPRRDTWLALLLFTGLALLFAYPISLHPATLRFPTGPDGDLGWYLLGWDAHAFLHRPWAIFAAPVVWLTGNLLLAANFVSLLSAVLCGLGAYVLARRVGLSLAAAIICGIIFECAPPRFFRIGQINLTNVQWIPFGLAALHAYVDTGRRRPLHLAIVCFTLQALSCAYAAVFMTVTVLIFILYYILAGEPLQPLKRVRDVGLTGLLLLAPAILIFIPYQLVQRQAGLRRGLGTWEANYSSFIASPSHLHGVVRSLFTDTKLAAAAYLFPGYLAVALALAAIVAGAILMRQWIGRSTDRDWPTSVRSVAHIYWRPVLALILVMAASSALGAIRRMVPAGTGLKADYFARSKYEAPVVSAIDAQPSTEALVARRANAAPGPFSVTWSGYLSTLRSGLYFFATTSRNASRLYIDGQPVVDNKGGQENGQAGNVRLDRGAHIVVVEYDDLGATATMKWEWIYDGDRDRAYKVVPTWALSTRPVATTTVMTARGLEFLQLMAQVALFGVAIWLLFAIPLSRHAVWERSLASYRRNPIGFYVVLMVLFTGFALGPPFGLWQFVYWMPGFNLVRAYSRFAIVALLGVAVLAGAGFDVITAGFRQKTRLAAAVAACLLLLAEYAAMPMASQPGNFEVPAIDRWLATRPRPFVVAEVPVFNASAVNLFEQTETNYMIHSSAHWQKTVHGYSGWRTERASQLFADMESFPDDTSLASLEAVGVTYVVVHSELYQPAEWQRVVDRIGRYGSRLRFVHAEGPGQVYALPARSEGPAKTGLHE